MIEVEQLSLFTMLSAGHPMVLRPADGTEETIPDGHRYYHYTIGNRLFSGVFVGRERVRT